MYLKNLTVLGFKSFAEKTTLNFQRGIAAIVGPNGCGKSNVADAIRWVLGEQSAKALRGGEMADVIFNGTDKRKPLGMAEVSLTIGDVDTEQLRAAGVNLDYSEVTVTRRVFRDGGSDYFINRTPCRLRDIQQLFMGTGMGKTSYSIMAQGNITQLLSSKPEDRRLVFEEAAGITRFKAQKREALRKLEQTEQNLLRVQDLIREVKRQIGSLQRQAGKARRYKQLAAELQHLETQLARHQYDVLQGEIREREEAAERARLEVEIAAETIVRSEDEIRQLRERLTELEHAIAVAQQRGTELKAEADREENRILFTEERLRELEQQNARAVAEIAQAQERRLVAEQELASVAARLAEAEAGLAEQRAAVAERKAALGRIETGLQAQQQAFRDAQSAAFASAQQVTRVRNELTALDLQKQAHAIRLDKLSSEKIQLEEERHRLEQRLAEFATNVEAEKAAIQAHRGTVEERQARLGELHQQLQQAGQGLDGLTRRQAEVRSRLQILEQLEASHEGFGTGAVAALQQGLPVLGSLADRIGVPDARFVRAVEAALGHHLQLVLTEQPETAQAILADLAAKKRGRASIAALSLGQRLESAAGALPAPPGATPAASVIECDDTARPLVAALLAGTWIVPDLAAATAAWREVSGAFDFVTEAGELLTRHGVFTGGAGNGHGRPEASILARKNQITELRAALAQVQEEVAEASRRRGSLQAEQTDLQAGLQQAQTELRTEEVALATRQGEFNALQNARRVLHQKIDTVVYEIESLAGQDREAAARRDELAARLATGEAAEQAAQSQLVTLNAGLDESRRQREESAAALTEVKIALAAGEQVAASFAGQRAPLDQRIRELAQLVTERDAELGGFGHRRAQAEEAIVAARAAIGRLAHEREVQSARTAELLAERHTQAAAVDERETLLRDIRARHAGLQQRRGQLEIELTQRRMTAQNLVERLQQKYQRNLADIRGECITITYADEGQPRVQTLTPEEMAASGAGTDWDAVGAQVLALQKKVDEMGPVNLVAIEEYEEAEQRHTFLSTQHDDLVQAKAQLTEVIHRINTETQALFAETFQKIRENFQAMFAEIFNGGHADLRLENEGDVLESGIEIMARPPGKQLRGISLLSGGEQTMTAVALLFAIYQVKPSPFAVLDELDAPLDESNINRFVRIVQRFLERSQFIIITHNKRTIGMADVLYGVTMQEQGVSKIVSVKFHKADDSAAETTPLVPPAENVRPIEPEEDAAHRREETIEVVMAK
ncbi:MAG: chromosome segregation protein SMC [Limisphaerales bacterium]